MSESDPGPDGGPGDQPGGADGVDPSGSAGDRTPREWARWVLTTDNNIVSYLREVLSSVLAVVLVGVVLFAVSGLWPPMVAVESPSMRPNLQTGDLVFVMEEHRLSPEAAHEDTGVVTYNGGKAAGYRKFGRPGDVIVYRPDGETDRTPIIHRAMFYVNGSENWYEEAVALDPQAVGAASNCEELRSCPAPHAGFITKGDNERTNVQYDQASGLSAPVRPGWVVGTAEFRIPLLGNIRLWAARTGAVGGAERAVSAGAVSGVDNPESTVAGTDAPTGTGAVTPATPNRPTGPAVTPGTSPVYAAG